MANKADTYYEQNLLQFSVTFTDELTGDLVNPAQVAFGYRVNGGSITSEIYGTSGSTIENPSTGVYTINVDTTGLPGTWVWEWQSVGVGQSAVAGSLTVSRAVMSLLNS